MNQCQESLNQLTPALTRVQEQKLMAVAAPQTRQCQFDYPKSG